MSAAPKELDLEKSGEVFPPSSETLSPETQLDNNDTDQRDAKISVPPVSKPVDPAPDGGLAAWLVVLGAWCTSFCSFGWINSVGVFQDYYETTLLTSYSASTIAWIPSLQIFFMFAMGPIVGQLYDRYGPRYVILVGSLLDVFGLMMASISTEYYQLLLSQGVCSAIGVAAIFQPAMNCVGTWFDKKRGAAYGVLATGSSLGGVIFPILVSRLIAEVGYGWTMRIAAFMILFLLVIANLTVRSRFPPRAPQLDGAVFVRPFREIGSVLTMIGIFLLTFGIFIPINYVILDAMAQGMSANLAQYLVPILNAASLFGRLLSGVFSDKIGRYNILVLACLLSAVMVLALWIPASGNAAIIVFATFFGFASGSYVSVTPTLIMQISPFKEWGYRNGLLFFFASFGGLTTNPIAGAILSDSHGSYRNMKIFAGIFLVAGSIGVLAARFHHTGMKLIAKF